MLMVTLVYAFLLSLLAPPQPIRSALLTLGAIKPGSGTPRRLGTALSFTRSPQSPVDRLSPIPLFSNSRMTYILVLAGIRQVTVQSIIFPVCSSVSHAPSLNMRDSMFDVQFSWPECKHNILSIDLLSKP
jgi:hypothetical protein